MAMVHKKADGIQFQDLHLTILVVKRISRFLAVSKSNTFEDARPEIGAVAVTVLLHYSGVHSRPFRTLP
jgi:hypothetical protein